MDGLGKDRELNGRSTLDGWPPQAVLARRPPLVRCGGRAEAPYLVLDVGVDSLQHPLTGVLIGQVRVYLWDRQADGGQETWCRGPAMLSTGSGDLAPLLGLPAPQGTPRGSPGLRT